MPARTSSARASAAANGNRAAMDCGPATAYCSPPHQVVRSVLKSRCRWSAAAPEFPVYHDTEWGFPVSNDFRLFEKLSLEGFQSGLRALQTQFFKQAKVIADWEAPLGIVIDGKLGCGCAPATARLQHAPNDLMWWAAICSG